MIDGWLIDAGGIWTCLCSNAWFYGTTPCQLTGRGTKWGHLNMSPTLTLTRIWPCDPRCDPVTYDIILKSCSMWVQQLKAAEPSMPTVASQLDGAMLPAILYHISVNLCSPFWAAIVLCMYLARIPLVPSFTSPSQLVGTTSFASARSTTFQWCT